MVSIFCRKLKNDPFWPKLTTIWPKFGLICLYRSSVRPLVTALLEVRSLLFSETLQLVRTQKGGKKSPSAFLLIFTLLACLATTKTCPKLPFLAPNAQN